MSLSSAQLIHTDSELHVELASFRDREARVFLDGDRVYRGLSAIALRDYREISSKPFFLEGLRDGSLIGTSELPTAQIPSSPSMQGWAAFLEHEKIQFVSYPYEWCFSMLQDAALLQLKLLEAALDEDFILKDSSAFNFQFRGAKPIFIDIPSFEKLRPGEPWAGYRQFCEMFLFPLMLQAYKGIPFQSWLRGNIEGLPVAEFWNIMSFRDIFRPGVLKHVFLQQMLQFSYQDSKRDLKKELVQVGFHKELIKMNVAALTKLVKRLRPASLKTVWADYARNNSYTDADMRAKQDFVRQVVKARKLNLVWDLGCNTGTFSRIASENSDLVIAMDFDHGAIEGLYHDLSSTGNTHILPLVINLANPSPNHGWRGLERKGLGERGKPDLILALALIHHAVLSANIPLAEFIAWLASFNADLILEFVSRDDPMVKKLLLNKRDNYSDYSLDNCEAVLRQHFHIELSEKLLSGSRVIFHCRRS